MFSGKNRPGCKLILVSFASNSRHLIGEAIYNIYISTHDLTTGVFPTSASNADKFQTIQTNHNKDFPT